MSCCGRKNSKFYDRPSLGQNCCGSQSVNSCCNNSTSNNSCCGSTNSSNYSNDSNYSNNSCCGNSNSSSSNTCRNYMTTRKNNSYYNDKDYSKCYMNNACFDGLSCPCHENNDRSCEDSLRDALSTLTNQRVVIHIDGCKMCVVIVSVGDCFVKAINPCTQKIVYFNINRIDNVEDVLPRCY